MVKLAAVSQPCYVAFTNKARQDFQNYQLDPQEFISLQDSFAVHIERTSRGNDDGLYVQIYFDAQKNSVMMEEFEEGAPNIRCVVKEKVLLVTSFNASSRSYGGENNRRISTKLHFFKEDAMVSPVPEELLAEIKSLPIARERSEEVKSRLESWESYLTLLESKAANNEVKLDFSLGRVKNNLKELIIYSPELHKTEGKKLTRANIKLVESGENIGSLKKIDRHKNIIEVKLNEDYVELLERNKWNPPAKGTLHISNYGDLAQVRRLRWGFRDLINGKAKNPNLENFLFEEEPLIRPSEPFETLEFNQKLDEYQRKAVTGAMAANDLYLIQGPPGTGKTTVITEICYQNVKKGLKTLVASQSNLAVDNALSRLLVNEEVRILRKGRTTSIEEEGKKFIEENISETWKHQTIFTIKQDIKSLEHTLEQKEQKKAEIEQGLQEIERSQKELQEVLSNMELAQKNKVQLAENLRFYRIKKQNMLVQIEKEEKLEKEAISLLQVLNEEVVELQNSLTSKKYLHDYKKKQEELEKKQIEYKERMAIKELQKALEVKIDGLIMSGKQEENIQSELALLNKVKRNIFSTTYITLKSELNKLKSYGLEVERLSTVDLTVLDLKRRLASSNISNLQEEYEGYRKSLKLVIEMLEGFLVQYNYDVRSASAYFANAYKADSTEYTEKDIRSMADRYYYIDPSQAPSGIDKWINKIFKKPTKKFDALLEKYRTAIEMKEYVVCHLKSLEVEQGKEEKLKIDLVKELERYQVEAALLITERINFLLKEEDRNKYEIDIAHKDVEESRKAISEKEKAAGLEENTERTITALVHYINSLKKEIADAGSEEEIKTNLENQIMKKKNQIQKEEHWLKTSIQTRQQNDEKAAVLKETIEQIELKLFSLEEELNFDVLKFKETIERKKREVKKAEKFLYEEFDDRVKNQLAVKNEWLELLKSSQEHDLEEIKRLYIKYANVIGITCVQSASKEFAEEYPDFDVVIIDEVSKAIPPELLLPMLKGKKVILVGDHKQLPPMIGQDTLDETVANIQDPAKQDEVKKILKESLFEHLFTTVPVENKTTLKIQYRMHKDIMDTISQFYNEENGHGLICGLPNSDEARDHKMNGKYVLRGQHLMWFDIPNEEGFFEAKEMNSTSSYNESELKIMESLLEDMEQAMAEAKQAGEIPQEEKKQVGMISFYGDQVRKIEEMVEEKEYAHLSLRIGTVDRFQGMEMDVILASFVRNHNNADEGIGFSQDRRRLNVALSRARELLVIIGSSKMFTQKSKKAKGIYTNVAKIVHSKNGFRDHRGLAK